MPKATGWIPDECHGGLDKLKDLNIYICVGDWNLVQQRVHEVKLQTFDDGGDGDGDN